MESEYTQSLANILRINDVKRIWQFMYDGDDVAPEKKYSLFVTAHFGSKQREVAELHASHFRNKLDRRVLGRGRRLYKALFIEEGAERSFNERHAHWLMEKPKHMTRADFTDVFVELWQEVCGSDDVQIKPVLQKKGGLSGLSIYLTKERDKDDEIGRISFVSDFSDNARLQKNRQHRRV